MAVDCLAGYLYELEKDGEKYPGATAMKDISLEKIAKELDVEMNDAFVNMISVDVDEYAKNHNKVVPRTLTIWNIYNCVSKKPKHEKLPPLIAVLSICMLILMNVFQLVYAVQLSKNVDRIDCLLYVYHANILILSARIIQKHMVEEVEILKNRISEGNGRKGINAFVNKIDSISKYLPILLTGLFQSRFHYLMMKPMEWIFLIALYMVDSRPEQRIARQYSYKCNQHDY